MSKKFIVNATMDVGYKAIIVAENKDKAWQIAKNNDCVNWEQSDKGHDWILEDIYEEENYE